MPNPDKRMVTLYKYFGKQPNQSMKDFKDEINELTDEDKTQLTNGITDSTLTY